MEIKNSTRLSRGKGKVRHSYDLFRSKFGINEYYEAKCIVRPKLHLFSPMATSLCALLLTVFLFLLCKKNMSKAARNLPPGPPYWPLLGNLFPCNNNHTFHVMMDKLQAKYGPIFTLRRGRTPFIIVTSAELIREALVEKGRVLCSRPPAAGPPTIGSTAQGTFLRTLRKNIATETLHPARLKALRPFRQRAIEGLVDRLRKEAAQNGGAVMVSENIRTTLFGILIYLCFGFEMDANYLWEFQAAMTDVLHKGKVLAMDYHPFPLLNFFESSKERDQTLSRGAGLVFSLIQRRRQMISDGSATGDAAYVDTLFALQLTDSELVGLCSEFVHAGSHTTSTTLQFALANLIIHPHIQSKLYDDIVGVVGSRATEVEDVVEKMGYLEAVVMETLRKHIPAYFALPYAATQDCTLGGYDVPTGAIVNLYLKGMTKDPKLWEHPSDFFPERFWNAEVDVTGTKEMKMIPFGSGRRMCPGLGLAMMNLRVIIARLVQAFEWKCMPGETVELSETDDFLEVIASAACSLRNPLKAMVIERH